MPRQEWVGIEPMGEVFLLTFLFIGLVRSTQPCAVAPGRVPTATISPPDVCDTQRSARVAPGGVVSVSHPTPDTGTPRASAGHPGPTPSGNHHGAGFRTASCQYRPPPGCETRP